MLNPAGETLKEKCGKAISWINGAQCEQMLENNQA